MVSYDSSIHALQELLLKPLSSARQSNRSKKRRIIAILLKIIMIIIVRCLFTNVI
jgi:hypothetical protein